jgi:hypothetical protein
VYKSHNREEEQNVSLSILSMPPPPIANEWEYLAVFGNIDSVQFDESNGDYRSPKLVGELCPANLICSFCYPKVFEDVADLVWDCIISIRTYQCKVYGPRAKLVFAGLHHGSFVDSFEYWQTSPNITSRSLLVRRSSCFLRAQSSGLNISDKTPHHVAAKHLVFRCKKDVLLKSKKQDMSIRPIRTLSDSWVQTTTQQI